MLVSLPLHWSNFAGVNSMVTSDCKYAGETNAAGQVWCEKKKIYVSAREKDTCEFYEK